MVFGCTFWTLGFIYPNEHKFHPVATNLIRGAMVTVICYLFGRWKGYDLTFPDAHNFKYQIIRNSIMVVQGLSYAWVQFYLPLPIATTLGCASPIFAAVFDWILNKISLNCMQTFWLVIAFLGVVLTANGSYITYLITGRESEGSTRFNNYLDRDPVVMMTAAVVYTCVMIMHGYGVVVTKKLIGTNSIQVNYFQGILILLANAVLTPFGQADSTYHYPSMSEFGWGLLYSGISVTIGQLAYVGSLLICHRYAMLTPFSFTSILVGYLVSVLRYG